MIVSIYGIKLGSGDVRDKTLLSSYEDLSAFLFSKRLTTFVEINIVLFCFGVMVAYFVTLMDVGIDVMEELYPEKIGQGYIYMERWFTVSILAVIFIFPLSLKRTMSAFRYSSFICVTAIVWTTIVVLIKAEYQLVNDKDHSWFDDIKYYTTWNGIFEALPVFVFAFCCQVNVFSIYTELQGAIS